MIINKKKQITLTYCNGIKNKNTGDGKFIKEYEYHFDICIYIDFYTLLLIINKISSFALQVSGIIFTTKSNLWGDPTVGHSPISLNLFLN